MAIARNSTSALHYQCGPLRLEYRLCIVGGYLSVRSGGARNLQIDGDEAWRTRIIVAKMSMGEDEQYLINTRRPEH